MKPGTHIVSTPDGVEIGALDRVVRERRALVYTFMEGPDERTAAAVTRNTAAQEILTRTRSIDEKTRSLMALLRLLEEQEGESPLAAIKETLIQILVEQKDTTARLTRIEKALAGR